MFRFFSRNAFWLSGLIDVGSWREQQTKLKLSDVVQKKGNIGPLGLAHTKDAQLFSRAQFTSDEVRNLRSQFEQMDFVGFFLILIFRQSSSLIYVVSALVVTFAHFLLTQTSAPLNLILPPAEYLPAISLPLFHALSFPRTYLCVPFHFNFDLRDQDHDQRITRADLVRAMTDMGYDASIERADNILREVDFSRKGAIEFQDYLDVSSFVSLARIPTRDSVSHLSLENVPTEAMFFGCAS